MLKKSREEILRDLQHRICNDLNHLTVSETTPNPWGGTDYRSWQYHDKDLNWNSRPVRTQDRINNWGYSYGSDKNYCGPEGMEYWPPELPEFIKRVALATACAIVDAIYTESEAEAKIEKDLLGNNDNN